MEMADWIGFQWREIIFRCGVVCIIFPPVHSIGRSKGDLGYQAVIRYTVCITNSRHLTEMI